MAGRAEDGEGWSPLHKAAANGRTEQLRKLIALGAQVNSRTKNGRTALYLAAVDGSEECVELLLANEADPSIRNEEGRSAEEVARLFCHHGVVALLRGERKVPEESRISKISMLPDAKDELLAAACVGEGGAKNSVTEERRDWKKTDFAKWSKLRAADWDVIEEKVSKDVESSSTAVHRTTKQQQQHQAAERDYGSGKVGPPKHLHPHQPRYSEYQR
eukprot:35531-Hanusia_phi.AAC.1